MQKIFEAEWDEGSWREQARCKDVDPNIFFKECSEDEAAKRICAECVVRSECLNFALDTNQEDGVWGGLNQRERRRMKRLNKAS